MAKLTNAHKELIVRSLACYSSPIEIVALFKTEHGMELSLSQLTFYNPDTLTSARLADKWRQLFHTARQKYLKEVVSVPLAHKAYRLNMLQKNLDEAMIKKNIVLANQIIEQAAKEMGGVNERGGGVEVEKKERNIFMVLQEVHQRIKNEQLLQNKAYEKTNTRVSLT
jgi:hypothetical protein